MGNNNQTKKRKKKKRNRGSKIGEDSSNNQQSRKIPKRLRSYVTHTLAPVWYIVDAHMGVVPRTRAAARCCMYEEPVDRYRGPDRLFSKLLVAAQLFPCPCRGRSNGMYLRVPQIHDDI